MVTLMYLDYVESHGAVPRRNTGMEQPGALLEDVKEFVQKISGILV
jgi:hypothetical protein